ncbi:MAG: transcriptional coactivator p15/PC4 family protein [bacterium]
MGKIVDQFTKNATEEVRVSITEFRGHQLIDFRIYVEPKDGGERKPTKKGITINVNLYPKLKKAILKAEKELIKEGLIEEEALEQITNEDAS